MPVRSLSARSFFDPEFIHPGCLKPGTLPWVLAKERSRWFPAWLFNSWRGAGQLGRDAWPAAVLASLLLLRWSEEGVSRRAAARRADTDLTWRAAMGLQAGAPTPSEKTLRDFERFLMRRHEETQTTRFMLLHEHIVRCCLDAGIARGKGAVFAMDSTPMWCFGAVRDTVRLLGDGVQMLAREWARHTKTEIGVLAKEWGCPFLTAKSTKGAFSINWSDVHAKTDVITKIVRVVLKVVVVVRREIGNIARSKRKRILRLASRLLKVIETDLDRGEDGRLAIAERVAAGRLVSITDPEARHGRKSKSSTFNGFKAHVLGDAISGLLVSVAVTRGNVHDAEPAHRLVARAKSLNAEINVVLADTAYGGARLRHIVQRAERVKLISPPPPTTSVKQNKFGKLNVLLSEDGCKATCANKVTTEDRRFTWSSDHGTHTPVFVWPKETCDACPLTKDCRGDQTRRRVILHPYERELREARVEWENEDTREEYRVRTQCERLINELTRHGGRHARAFGLQKAQLQAHSIAMTVNLRLLAQALARDQDELSRAA